MAHTGLLCICLMLNPIRKRHFIFDEVTLVRCYMFDIGGTIPAAGFKSVTMAISIVSHRPLRRVLAMLPKTTGTLAARKHGC